MTHTAKVVCYSVQCPACNFRTLRSVAQLIGLSEMPCEPPQGCGATINVQSGEASTVITKLWHACQEIDAELSKIG
jgi:hypothetical protein